MEKVINKQACQHILTRIEEAATAQGWHAMRETYTYKEITRILATEDEAITYVDKEIMRNSLSLLSSCCGLWYYSLLKEAYAIARA